VIVHIIWRLDIGGGEVFLRSLSKALATHGVVQRIFTIGPRGRLADEIEAAGVPVTAFNKSSKPGIVAIARMTRALRRLRPTLVQTHGEGGLFWGVPAARLAGVPVVSLIYQTHEETLLKTLAARVALRQTRQVIAGSRAAEAFARERFHVPANRVRTIHCGIESDVVPAAHGPGCRTSGEWPVLLTVGRLVSVKGHRTLIEAFALLRCDYPRARLIIVGDGPERISLERQAANLNVASAVTFAGTVYPTREVLARADVFVFPSLVEPQGLVVLEAYAAGVPVVASRTGGIPEMLEDGVDGLLANRGDAADLAEVIRRMIDDESLRAACTMHARSRLPEFDIAKLAGDYLEIYR
jgi:glycosyltransferase involved in cell wall biosynthesis